MSKLLKPLLIIMVLIISLSLLIVLILKLRPHIGSLLNNEQYSWNDEEIDAGLLDVKTYFEDNSEEIINTIKVEDSENIYSEKDIYNEVEKRGFSEIDITTEYDYEGHYVSSYAMSRKSKKKHPVYQFQYVSKSNDTWIIFIIDSQIIAYPVSFNMFSSTNTKVVLSETNTITSYDSNTNMFYKTIPKKSELRVVVVDIIDSSTLDMITSGDLEE